jgi:ATP-binding cassette subfamily B protein
VRVDGRDIRELDLGELRRQVTVLFQEPVHYSETVRRNVELGDLRLTESADRLRRVMAAAGADETVGRLPDGADTLLGTWFAGGAELSVGEWQRIALSRAFLRDAPIILLDEPTSFMDSWSEADWMARFRLLAAGRTAVLITHRLSTAMRADAVFVMEEGSIIESGSHDELMAMEGRYAAAWNAQNSQR